ncbi:sensor histidine kinase [Paenibacillus sp. GP183]|uniref:sensor histidine kinase n=1 Tax=Paenibacillus sp. GP183 TaxID=1882751 RepID=UPI00089C46FB|nr:sensor histidine kinase [Paenibacillus sp. GP183]SEC02689.1 two-component system, sensor histidine kinase YesM [Paenibacillus sp. GP183]
MKIRSLLAVPFRRLLIRNKIIVVFFPLIIIPLFTLGYFTSHMFTSSLIGKTKQNVLDESALILTRIDSMIRNSESSANIIMENFDHIYQNYAPSDNPIEENQRRMRIQTMFDLELFNFPDVDSVAFIDSRGKLYTSYFPEKDNDVKIFGSELLIHIGELPGYGVNNWFPMQHRDFLVTDPDVPVLSIGKQIIDLKYCLPYGILIVNIKESELSSVYAKMVSYPKEHYRIIDSQGTVISSSYKSELMKPLQDEALRKLILSRDSFSEIAHTQTGTNLVTSVGYAKMGWKLVNIVPEQAITADIRKNIRMTVIIGSICLVFALLGASILSRVIVSPLQKLAKAMRQVKEVELNVLAHIQTADEIGMLASVFNSMIARMKELLQRVEAEQKRKKEYELALIHAQIKPHFLYNTLDLIYLLNDLDRSGEARDTAKALADFYRVALSKGSEMITVGEEIKNAKDYLSIQRARYSDVFDFDIDVPQDVMRSVIPKLSIQPLVENAIYHGLKTKGSLGHIDIGGFRDQQAVTIVVSDDGVGMPESKLREIWSRWSSDDKPVSFGIFSVHERIRLYFGNEYGVTISSREHEGTEVRIRLPG